MACGLLVVLYSKSESEGEEMDCNAPHDDKNDEAAMPGVSRDTVACGSPASGYTTAVNSVQKGKSTTNIC